jgi:hypothetical protein
MPQVVFSPGDRQSSELNQLAFQAMSENLAENVKYRRSQQQRKAATAQDMQDKMALGLIPKSEITVTDEGFKFKDDEAKASYYNQLANMFGQDNMSREGRTDITLDPKSIQANEQRFAQGVNAAQQAALGTEQDQRVRNMVEQQAGNVLSLQTSGMSPNDQPGSAQAAANQNFNMVSNYVSANQPSNLQARQQALQEAISGVGLLQTNNNAVAANQVANVANLVGAPAATATPAGTSVTTTAAGKPPLSAKQSQNAKVTTGGGRTGASNTVTEMDQAKAAYETGGFKYKQDDYALQTTEKKSARLDEIKTSMKNLLGLSALENYSNQLMRTGDYNQTAPLNSTFKTAFDQRAAELKRWEEAATTDGKAQTMQKIGERNIDVAGQKYAIESTRKDALAAQTIIQGSSATASTGAVTQAGTPSGGGGGSTTWHSQWGANVLPDMTLDATGNALLSDVNNLVIHPQMQPFSSSSKSQFDAYNSNTGKYGLAGLKANKIKDAVTGNDVIEWKDASGKVLGVAFWDKDQTKYNKLGMPVQDPSGAIEKGNWTLQVKAGATRSQIEAIQGVNFQKK